MAKVQAFLSLEKSISTTMAAVWSQAARKTLDQILPLLEQRRWDDAHDVANRLTLNGVVESHRRRLEELAVSALLFGAHHVTGSVQSTSFTKGTQPVPYTLQTAIDQLTVSVETNGAELVRNQLHALIRLEETKSTVGLVEIAKADMDLADRLNAAVLGTGRMVIDIGANLTTSRLVSLGFLVEAIEHKIETYQVSEVLDQRTCAVCKYMHGKTFNVAQEYSRIMTALSTIDPNELKSIAPWPSHSQAGLSALNSMTLGEMQAAGFGSPPFHPLCRGVLVLAGTVTETIPLGGMRTAPQAPSPVTVPSLSEDKLVQWEIPEGHVLANRRQDLLRMFAAFESFPDVEMTVKALQNGDVVASLADLDDLNVVRKFKLGSGSLVVEHDYFKLPQGKQGIGIARKFLADSVSLYKSMGVVRVELYANIDVGGYAWAKYGFKPMSSSVDSLKKSLIDTVDWLLNEGEITEAQKDVVMSIITVDSHDGSFIWDIADLTIPTTKGYPLGKRLLLGESWDAYLDLSDLEAMARFENYVGRK